MNSPQLTLSQRLLLNQLANTPLKSQFLRYGLGLIVYILVAIGVLLEILNWVLLDLQSGVLVWELRVVAWDVSYGAEFVPSAEDAYTIILQKTRKVAPSDEPVISNSYKIGDSGKVVLTIDNQSSKKKKLLYRSKTKPSSD